MGDLGWGAEPLLITNMRVQFKRDLASDSPVCVSFAVVAEFFSACCAPEAQREQATLCRLCKKPDCLASDPYAGYAGALK